MEKIKRFIPLVIIVILIILAYSFGIGDYLTFDNLKAHRKVLKEFIAQYPLLVPLIFIAIYIVATALSIPGGLFLTITAGFLFPFPWGLLYVVIGATIGAMIIFLCIRFAFADLFLKKAKPLLHKLQKGFKKNQASYLLFLRFIPIFPFWLINIAAAVFNVPFVTFAWTTFVGIIPGSFVFTQAGEGLGAIFDTEGKLSIGAILNKKVWIAFIALGLFALLPILYRKLKDDRK